ncbi:MAG: undecaprenyldiphospho-muramoylpentapeptide beta-N-acetylglucosaminyltransferase [Bacteroidales bacterium]|jgi:UDP-N-acetylglucosamine--N-acetylmuramyl-(pentapeptide) pyrophosphoryl-undecaprenol N-acetylglucosamine transferase|nr:undecaprenyldiphospho-muramoylpentapeptide beta-N-acetylglucosaminyltransferase [Bacteroidales bacterium]
MDESNRINDQNLDAAKTYRRVIISGGGTGGHIFPAIAIANALSAKDPSIRILFVGAEGRMEMEKVPKAGYKIIGLPVRGFDRKNLFRNFRVLYLLIRSIYIARIIIKRFHPDAVIGVGGYASGPVLYAACKKGIPTLIQEQNSYAGVTNKLLAKKVDKICVAYDDMERFFPKEKIIITGNPVRRRLTECVVMRDQSMLFFDFHEDKPTILVLGGSLGARTINQSVLGSLEHFPSDIYLIWQTGISYYEKAKQAVLDKQLHHQIKVFQFIERVDLAYTAADLVISRAGASTISELCIKGKPSILVPSPNVAEDHQTKNAMALVKKEAAIMIPDDQAVKKLMDTAISTVRNPQMLEPLSDNIRELARFNAARKIADIVIQLMEDKQ